MARKSKKKFIAKKHVLMPKHTKLSDKEIQKLFSTYKITFSELPKIMKNDPALHELDAKEGDVIKIVRKSVTSGTSTYYRGVTNV